MGKEGRGFFERHIKAKKMYREQLEMTGLMNGVDIFKGDAEDFFAEKGVKCEPIKSDEVQQFLIGGTARWELVDDEGKQLLRFSDLLSPLNLPKLWPSIRERTYSEIKLAAAKLGADAIIEHIITGEGKDRVESGVPVKIVRKHI